MKLFFLTLALMSMFTYGCKNSVSSAHTHTAHEHDTHHHETEGHNHEAEGEEHNHKHNHDQDDNHNHEYEHNHEHDAVPSEHKYSDEIIFSKEQAARTDFKVETVQPGTFHQVIKTTGQILPAPGDESAIVATNNGVISFAKNTLTEGSPVKQGQILFHIASKNLGEGDYYAKTQAAYEKAKNEYERAEQLIKDKIISQKDYESIRLEYRNAKIAFDAISGKQSAKGVGVSSPLNGYMKNILVKDGEYVTAGQSLATVSQNKRLILRADVPEKYYNVLKNIRTANFKTPYDNQVYDLDQLEGQLLSAGKTAGENNFFVPVTFELNNRGDIIPGSFTEIYLISSPIADALTIPVTALTNEMGIFYVYVQLDEEGYRKQEIKTGADDGKNVLVLSGLKAGDKVVTRGAYQVKMASASGAIPGHSHEH